MISQSIQIDKKMADTIRILVGYYQSFIVSDDLGIKCLFKIMKYQAKINGEVIGDIVVHGIVYYDWTAHDLFFDIEHQLYLY